MSPKRQYVRNVARAIAIIVPIVLVPLMLESGATAKGQIGGPTCDHGSLGGVSNMTVNSNAKVTVKLLESACTSQVVTLVSYQTEGPAYNSAGTQTLFDADTETVTAGATTLSIHVPNCYFQVDLIYGNVTPITLLDQELYFTKNGSLIASRNAGLKECEHSPTPAKASVSMLVPKPPTSSRPPASATEAVPSAASVSASGATTANAGTTGLGTVSPPSVRTSVLGVIFTKAPSASDLPFTGMSVFAIVRLGLGLLGGGVLAVLFVRRRSGGVHR